MVNLAVIRHRFNYAGLKIKDRAGGTVPGTKRDDQAIAGVIPGNHIALRQYGLCREGSERQREQERAQKTGLIEPQLLHGRPNSTGNASAHPQS